MNKSGKTHFVEWILVLALGYVLVSVGFAWSDVDGPVCVEEIVSHGFYGMDGEYYNILQGPFGISRIDSFTVGYCFYLEKHWWWDDIYQFDGRVEDGVE